MENSEIILQEFKNSFKQNLQKTSDEKFIEVLYPNQLKGTLRNYRTHYRTQFYSKYLCSKIADDLKLEIEYEFLRIDIHLSKRSELGFAATKIYIETENLLNEDIDQELAALCSVYAPLKVVITWTSDWDAIRDDYLNETWNYVINSYGDILGNLPGILIIIVAETKVNSDTKQIKFYASRWRWNDQDVKTGGQNGKFDDVDELLFERTFS